MSGKVSFGRWLTARRKALGLSCAELARRTPCATITLRKIENDTRRPSNELAALLADRLELPKHLHTLFIRVARGEAPVEHIATMLASDSQPSTRAVVAHQRRSIPTNLPAPLTSFVGRETEIESLLSAIVSERLITLTGVGGIGKTRIAIELGMHLIQVNNGNLFCDGVWLVELAALDDRQHVPHAIAQLWNLPEPTEHPMLQVLQNQLANKQILLILDSCEHLIDACAPIVEQLLQHCWQLHILTTSREPLHISGEFLVPIQPLALPDASEVVAQRILTTAAAQLLIARIEKNVSYQNHFEPEAYPKEISQICRQLDGIPLAIELAAPLASHLSLAEIVQQLQHQMATLTTIYRTATSRHRTMYNALAWSYRLLAEHEQLLLLQVSVFVGGWTQQAALAMGGTTEVLPIIQQLIAKSLVVWETKADQRRYRLLEPIRQFAQAQVAQNEQQHALRQQHLEYMLHFCEQVSPALGNYELFGENLANQSEQDARNDQITNYARVAHDLDNMRLALDWAAETQATDTGLRILVATAQLFIVYGLQQELLTRLELFLGMPAPAGAVVTCSRACLWLTYIFTQRLSDIERGSFWLAEAASLVAQTDQPLLHFSLLFLQTQHAKLRGSYALAHSFLEKQRQLVAANNYLGMDRGVVEDVMMRSTGLLLLAEGAYIACSQICEVSYQRHIRLGNRYASTGMARLLGYALLFSGSHTRAAALFSESLHGNIGFGDKQAIAACLAAFASHALVVGEYVRAAMLFGASEGQQAEIYTSLVAWDAEQAEHSIANLRKLLPAAMLEEAWAHGRQMPLEQAIAFALAEAADTESQQP
jgi:predicted ATPase/transcriptional regulator with XRE-family HTH domain